MPYKSPIYLQILSLTISLICIGKSVQVNVELYEHYMSATNKSRAFLGLVELVHIWRIWLFIPLVLVNIWLYVVLKNYLVKIWGLLLLVLAVLAGCMLMAHYWWWFV
jgi:hypothetical protein